MRTDALTHDRLIERIHYDPETGAFTRRPPFQNRKIGRIDRDGYTSIAIDKVIHLAHRLAWFYMTGTPLPPDYTIDHINLVRSDNRWANLRKATRSQNAWNMARRNNFSGVKGVDFHRPTGKWRSRCKVLGRRYTIGYFADLELADHCLREFRRKHHGDFANNG